VRRLARLLLYHDLLLLSADRLEKLRIIDELDGFLEPLRRRVFVAHAGDLHHRDVLEPVLLVAALEDAERVRAVHVVVAGEQNVAALLSRLLVHGGWRRVELHRPDLVWLAVGDGDVAEEIDTAAVDSAAAEDVGEAGGAHAGGPPAAGHARDVDAVLVDHVLLLHVVRRLDRQANAVRKQPVVPAVVGTGPDEVVAIEHVHPLAPRDAAARAGADPDDQPRGFGGVVILRDVQLEALLREVQLRDVLIPVKAAI
jgi:hypothetical protein